MATLEELNAKLDILLGKAGSNVVSITVCDSDLVGLAGVGITIRSPYDDLIGVAVSGAGGLASVLLDDGTYTFYLRKLGSSIVFANPYTIVVSGDTVVKLTATPPALSSPGDPSLSRVYGWVMDLGLTAQESIKIIFTLRESNVLTDTGIVLSDPIEVLTDATGMFEVELPVAVDLVPSNVKYVVEIEEAFKHAGWRQEFPAESLEAGGSHRLSGLTR